MTKETFKRHLISIGVTFFAVFFMAVGFEMSSPDFIFTASAVKLVVFSAIAAAGRAAFKIVYEVSYSVLSTKK